MNLIDTTYRKVKFAEFREIDPIKDQEVYASYNNYLGRIISFPGHLAMQSVCTIKLIMEKANPINWYKPGIFETFDKLCERVGYSPECSFMSYFPTFAGEFINVYDPVVIRAALKHLHNGASPDGIFVVSKFAEILLKVIKDIFPDTGITKEDVIITCPKETWDKLRTWLHDLMNSEALPDYQKTIQDITEETLSDWAKRCQEGECISLSETDLFASRVITALMFGKKIDKDKAQALAKAVGFINKYVLESPFKKFSAQEMKEYKDSCQAFHDAVESVYNEKDARLFQAQSCKDLNLAQKKAMAFFMFLAGQETVGFHLSTILLHLTQDLEVQNNLRDSIQENNSSDKGELHNKIEEIIKKSFIDYPPLFSIFLQINYNRDICLEYQFDGQDNVRKKVILKKGSILSNRVMDAAKIIKDEVAKNGGELPSYNSLSVFGSGYQMCPGRLLAQTEMHEFLMTSLKKYEFTAKYNKNPAPVTAKLSTKFVDNIEITVKPLS